MEFLKSLTLTHFSPPDLDAGCSVSSESRGNAVAREALNKHGKNQANIQLLKVLKPQGKNPSLKPKKASVKELTKECASII